LLAHNPQFLTGWRACERPSIPPLLGHTFRSLIPDTLRARLPTPTPLQTLSLIIYIWRCTRSPQGPNSWLLKLYKPFPARCSSRRPPCRGSTPRSVKHEGMTPLREERVKPYLIVVTTTKSREDPYEPPSPVSPFTDGPHQPARTKASPQLPSVL
jgi:hypothetical protein